MADLLFVCEGNVCRSPFAERVLRSSLKRVQQRPRLTIASAGLGGQPGAGMDEETERLVVELGGIAEGHRARRLANADLDAVTLVLTATRAQRAAVVAEHPKTIRHTYTIRQFGRVLHDVGDDLVLPPGLSQQERLAEIVKVYRSTLGSVAAVDDEDDVVDPHGRGPEVHRQAASQILPTLNLIATALGADPVDVPESLSGSVPGPRRSWRVGRRRHV